MPYHAPSRPGIILYTVRCREEKNTQRSYFGPSPDPTRHFVIRTKFFRRVFPEHGHIFQHFEVQEQLVGLVHLSLRVIGESSNYPLIIKRKPCILLVLIFSKTTLRPSQWSRGLRHELSSPTQTLGSWVLSLCFYSVFVQSCVQVAALRRADPSSKESYRLCEKSQQLKKRPRSNKVLQSHI
jgi:hypothetical protein